MKYTSPCRLQLRGRFVALDGLPLDVYSSPHEEASIARLDSDGEERSVAAPQCVLPAPLRLNQSGAPRVLFDRIQDPNCIPCNGFLVRALNFQCRFCSNGLVFLVMTRPLPLYFIGGLRPGDIEPLRVKSSPSRPPTEVWLHRLSKPFGATEVLLLLRSRHPIHFGTLFIDTPLEVFFVPLKRALVRYSAPRPHRFDVQRLFLLADFFLRSSIL